MSKKDAVILLAAFAAAACLFLLSWALPRGQSRTGEDPVAGLTITCDWDAPETDGNADFYLCVRFDGHERLIPLTRAGRVTLTQDNGQTNTVSVDKDTFCMLSANCPGQDCVAQGAVTPENRHSRALTSFVICLPHKLTLELMTAEAAGKAKYDE